MGTSKMDNIRKFDNLGTGLLIHFLVCFCAAPHGHVQPTSIGDARPVGGVRLYGS